MGGSERGRLGGGGLQPRPSLPLPPCPSPGCPSPRFLTCGPHLPLPSWPPPPLPPFSTLPLYPKPVSNTAPHSLLLPPWPPPACPTPHVSHVPQVSNYTDMAKKSYATRFSNGYVDSLLRQAGTFDNMDVLRAYVNRSCRSKTINKAAI